MTQIKSSTCLAALKRELTCHLHKFVTDQSTREPETSQLTDIYSFSTLITIKLVQKL